LFKVLVKRFYLAVFWISVLGLIAFVSDFGFDQSHQYQRLINRFYALVLALGLLATLMRYLLRPAFIKRPAFAFDLTTVLFTITLFYVHVQPELDSWAHRWLSELIWVKFAVIFTFIREVSERRLVYKRAVLNPAQIFIISFLAIIFLGSLLLLLPRATYEGISYLDALFTATSAVCVTGLIVVDTGSYFTLLGQSIIMVLIQIGGLGILTFASYFSYFFKGGVSYENQLVLRDMTSSQNLSKVFSTLRYILLITFGIEAVSALFIYFSLDSSSFTSVAEQMYFSAFHAVSAFCNAGFSTLPNSLYESGFRFNYPLQLVVVLTFILGGLGFPIVVNVLSYLRYSFTNLILLRKRAKNYRPWVLHINSRITLVTTLSLSLVAFGFFYVLEYHNTLAEHQGAGKVITALFGATTPRTAGFNSIDTAALSFPTIMMIILLMWVGASPQSTGGGIKTSTFAIATLNILSLAKGKDRIEIYRRQIASVSVQRAFATISLSLIAIGFSVALLASFDAQLSLKDIAFECFSAYSTVGLSLGITGSLSPPSKVVIILLMFVGRVTMLTLVIAVIRKARYKNYHYPTEEISIN